MESENRLDTHYAAPVNTPILPMPYLVQRTLSTIVNITLLNTCSSACVIYSITCTKCSILCIGETCRQLNTRFGEHLRSVEEKKHLSPDIRMMMTSTLQFIFTYPTTQSMTWEFLLFLYAPTKKLPRKALEEKSSLSLEQVPHLD